MGEKDYPLKVAALAVAGTLGFCTVLGTQWVIPTMTAAANHEVGLLKQKLEKVTDDSSAQRGLNEQKLRDLHDQLESRDALLAQRATKIAELEKRIYALETSNLFVKGDAYPVGLDRVKLGDPSTKVAEIFKGDEIKQDNRTVTVVRTGEIFRNISFSHSIKAQGKIESITFSYNALARIAARLPEISDDWLESLLKKALGEPRVIGQDNDCLLWFISDNQVVYYKQGEDWFEINALVTYPAGCWVTDEQHNKYKRKR